MDAAEADRILASSDSWIAAMKTAAGRRLAIKMSTAMACLVVMGVEWALWVCLYVAPWTHSRGPPHNAIDARAMGSLPIGLSHPLEVLGLNVASAIFIYNIQDSWSVYIKYFGRSHRAHGWPLAATSFQATLTVAVAVTVALTSRSASYFVDWMSAVRYAALLSKMHTKVLEALLAEATASGSALSIWLFISTVSLDLLFLLIGTTMAPRYGGVPLWACTACAESLAANAKASTNARTIFPNPPRSHTVDDVLNANRVNAAAREAESAEQGIVQQQHAVSDLSTPRTPGVNLTGDSTTAQRRRGATQHRRSIPGRALLPELEREVELSPTQKESTIEGGTGAGGSRRSPGEKLA